MGKSSKTQTETETGPAAMAAAMMAVSPASAKAWFDVMTETSRFLADRLQQDLETQKAMLSCRNPAELLKLQTEFYQKAFQQYSEEAMQLFKMMSDAAGKTVKEAQTSYSRKYDDIPL